MESLFCKISGLMNLSLQVFQKSFFKKKEGEKVL